MDSSEFAPIGQGGTGGHAIICADDATGLRPQQRIELYNMMLRERAPLTAANLQAMVDDCLSLAHTGEDERARASALKTLNEIRMGNVEIYGKVLVDSKPAPVSNNFNGPTQIVARMTDDEIAAAAQRVAERRKIAANGNGNGH